MLLFIFMLSCHGKIYAQNISDKKISFKVEDTSVSSALEMLYKQYNIKLAFSSTELNKFHIDKYSAENKSIKDVISDLLTNTGYLYKTIGNQIAIFKDNNINEDSPRSETITNNIQKQIKRTSNDTVYIVDTVTIIKNVKILQIDTIVKIDTMYKVDTVVVYKNRPVKMRMKHLASNFFAKDYSHNKKFSARLSYSQQFCSLSLKSNAPVYDEYCSLFNKAVNNKSFSNFQFDMEGGYTYNNWDFSVGISYNNMQHKFSFSESLMDETTHIIDTIDSYFVVNPISSDTSYFYILDTITIPPTLYQYSTNDINRLSFIGINLSAAYTFYHSDRIKLYLRAGLSIDFLVKVEGSYIKNTIENKVCKIDKDSFYGNRITYMFGIGTRFALTESLDLVPEIYFKHYCNSLIKDNQLDAKINCFGIKAGLYYYF